MPVGFGANRRQATRAVSVMVLTGAIVAASVHHASGQETVPKRPLGRGVPVFMPAPGEPAREAPEIRNPTGPLVLRDAVALALLQNPALAAFAWETRARDARMLQADRPPNPGVSVLFEDLGARQFAGGSLNEPIQTQATFQLSQLIELGGKRAARVDLATRNRDLAAWDYEAARIDVLTDVSRAFTDVLAAQESVAQIERTAQLVDQVRQSVALRVEAGVVSPIEETRAGVALGTVQVELARARRTLEASRIRLALLWGSRTPAFSAAEGNLTQEPAPLPSMDTLIARLQQNPELARWAAEQSQREAAVRVERSKAVPDVTLTGGYRRFTDVDANAFVVGASISLPLFDKNRGAIQESELRLAKTHEERRAAEARVGAALATAYAALATAHDEVTTLGSTVLPGSQQAFEAVSEGYRLGRFGYLDVLESQRTLVAAGSQYLRALSDYYKAVAAVERLIGAPLNETAGPPTANE
jgi:cobalt-zinc-cadmium efflux system outer membrane protein